MPFRLGPILPVLLGVASAQAALGLSTPLISLLLVRVGASSGAIGVVASAYYVGFLAGALTADRFVRRIGHIRTFAVMAAVAADASMVNVFADRAWVVAASRLFVGYASSGMFLVAESWLNDRADSAQRGRTFAAYLVASWGPAIAGPLLLDVVPPSPVLFACVGIAFATAVLPIGMTLQPNPEVRAQVRMGPAALFRISPIGAVCALAAGLLNSAYYAMAPVFLSSVGFDARAVATFTSVGLAAAMLIQIPVGILSDLVGRRPVALGAVSLGLAGAVGMMTWRHSGLLSLTALGAVYSGATAVLYGLGSGQTNDRLQRGDYVAASGGLLFTWSLGSSISPGLAGGVMGWFGPSGLLLYVIAVLAPVALFTLWRMLVRPDVPREARAPYVPAPAAPTRHTELAARAREVLRHPWRARTLLNTPTRHETVKEPSP